MLDNTKLLTEDLQIINRLASHPDFISCKPKNNSYHSICHKDFGVKLSLDFRKAIERGQIVGYRHLEISISPHYHFNNYKHNGNDFSYFDSWGTIITILDYLGIEADEFELLKVVNIEFGINIIPDMEIKNLINGLLFHKRTLFRVGNFPYFKKTEATKYKQIKAYAKGLQFTQFPEYCIDVNTFRFEVKSKESKNIRKYRIETAKDLLNVEVYKRLGNELLSEWENVLIINKTPFFEEQNKKVIKFIKEANKVEFWDKLKQADYVNKFTREKGKYYKNLGQKNNLHNLIKMKIINKISDLINDENYTPEVVKIPHRKKDKNTLVDGGENSTQKTMMESEKTEIKNSLENKINLEFSPLTLNNRLINTIKNKVFF